MDNINKGFDIRGKKSKFGPSCNRYEQQVEEERTHKRDESQHGVKGGLYPSENRPANPIALFSSSIRI